MKNISLSAVLVFVSLNLSGMEPAVKTSTDEQPNNLPPLTWKVHPDGIEGVRTGCLCAVDCQCGGVRMVRSKKAKTPEQKAADRAFCMMFAQGLQDLAREEREPQTASASTSSGATAASKSDAGFGSGFKQGFLKPKKKS